MAASQHGFNTPSGLILPVPSIQLASPRDPQLAAYNPSQAEFTVAINGDKLLMRRMPIISVLDVPAQAFDLDLRLELLWYTNRNRKANGGGVSGYKHPSHSLVDAPLSPTGAAPIAPVLPNSRFRGGNRQQMGINTVSEWTIKYNTQRFFIDTLGLFYTQGLINYNDAGGGASQTMYIPSCRAANGGYNSNLGGFGYSAQYRPNYFRFRFSVQDPNDTRARITGPVSQTITMANAVHPFIQDQIATQATGFTVLGISSYFQADMFNVWFETRLPSNK